MAWDNTDCVLALAFNSWSKGNGISDQNTGEMPGYPNGDYDATFTNMAAGYGYVYNAADGYCNPDSVNDEIRTTYDPEFTDANDWTFEIKFKFTNLAAHQTCWNGYKDSNNRYQCFITNPNFPQFHFRIGGTVKQVQASTTLTDGLDYTLHFVKDGATLKIYINGVEASYSEQDSYTLGTHTYGVGGRFFRRASALELAGPVYWAAIYERALSIPEALINHNLGNSMELIGNNTGDVMTLAPGGPGTCTSCDCEVEDFHYDSGVCTACKTLIETEHNYDKPCYRREIDSTWYCAWEQAYCNYNDGTECSAEGEEDVPITPRAIIGNWELYGHKGI